MDPITLGATLVGGLAALVAAWQKREKSKAELTIDTLIAAIELAEQVDPEVIKKLKAQVQDLAERTGVEANTLAPAVQRLIEELRRRNLIHLPGKKTELTAEVVRNARAKWRGISKITPILFILLFVAGCRLTSEGMMPAEGDEPPILFVAWPEGSPKNPEFYYTEWDAGLERMTTSIPYGPVPLETSY